MIVAQAGGPLEIQICGRLAFRYTQGRAAPFYRLPMKAWDTAYPVLLGYGALDEIQNRMISEYYHNVDTFNRGLEQTQSMRNGGGGQNNGSALLNDDFLRSALPAEAISNESDAYEESIRALV